MSFDHAEITIRVVRNANDNDPGVIYQNRRALSLNWLADTRYAGYATFEFQEMYDEMVNALKDAP